MGRGNQKVMSRRKTGPTAGRLVGRWHLTLSSQSFPSLSSLLPPPAKHCHGTELCRFLDTRARAHTHTHTKSGQLQGSKFQIWLHLEEALCEFLMETRILPQKFQVIHLRNSFHFTFLQISYLDDKKSLSRKRPAYACHSIGCKGKTYSLPEKVKTLHKKRGMG